MTYVVDSSVAVKWVVPEVLSDEADRILAGDDPLIAPDLLQVEAANALWKKAARKEISGREAGRALEVLAESAIVWWLVLVFACVREVNDPADTGAALALPNAGYLRTPIATR